jgi:hypothetical protein
VIVADLVSTVRSLLLGSLGAEATLLDGPYDPADDRLRFKYPKRGIAPGVVLSAGLNTFYVLETASQGAEAVVLSRFDGGPDLPLPDRQVVMIRPRITSWASFREIRTEARSLSSPLNGLFWPKVLAGPVDWSNGVYPLPDDFGTPLRLVRSRYKFSGETAYGTLGDAEYQVERNAIRVSATPPAAISVEFTFAMPFDIPEDLDAELDDLGITDALPNILATGAAATLVRSFEGRRVQPGSQGDTRRSEEVQTSSSSSLARQWRAEQGLAIQQEYARLLGTYGWQMPLPSGDERAWGQVAR